MLKKLLLPPALALAAFFLPACGSSKYTSAPRPAEQYLASNELPAPSTITIPISISVSDLVNSLNNRLNGPLYEDYSYSDNGNDGLMLKAMRSQPISLDLFGQSIRYRIPLKLWMKKNLLITDAEAEGELALGFKTTFSINPDWSLATQTEVEYHEWLAKPVLKTGIGDISVEALANLVLNRSKKSLSQSIDRIVGQQLNLRPYVEQVWMALQEPSLLSEEYHMWVKTTPTSIAMTPLTSDGRYIRGKIAIECINDVNFGEKPAFRPNASLPALSSIGYDDTPDEFQVRIATDVPFAEAERLAKGMMIGQVFQSGKKKVRVEDIQLWGNDDRVVVNSKLSGSFNGNIYFIGRPVYNPEKSQIEIADLDFHVDTKNFLHRSAAWLFQGPIKNQMRKAMTFPVEENIRELKSSIQQSLDHYDLAPGVLLTGTVDSVTVERTRVLQGSIRVDLFSKGKVNVDVRGL